MRESFVIHSEYIEDLPEEYKQKFLNLIYRYGILEEVPELNGLEYSLWVKIQRRIDMDHIQYENRKQKLKEYKESWKKKNDSVNPESFGIIRNHPESSGIIRNHSESSGIIPTNTHSVSVNDSVNVNVNDIVNDIVSVSVNDIDSVSDIEKGGQKSTVPQKKKFQKPTLEEIKAYVYEKSYTFDSEAFYNFYESNGWKVGKNSMKDWKAACKTWQQRETASGKKGRIASDEEVNLEEYPWAVPLQPLVKKEAW